MWALEHPGRTASWLEGVQGCAEASHPAPVLLGTRCFCEGELGVLRPQEGAGWARTPSGLPGARGCPTARDSGLPAAAAASQEARARPRRLRAGTCCGAEGFSPLWSPASRAQSMRIPSRKGGLRLQVSFEGPPAAPACPPRSPSSAELPPQPGLLQNPRPLPPARFRGPRSSPECADPPSASPPEDALPEGLGLPPRCPWGVGLWEQVAERRGTVGGGASRAAGQGPSGRRPAAVSPGAAVCQAGLLAALPPPGVGLRRLRGPSGPGLLCPLVAVSR